MLHYSMRLLICLALLLPPAGALGQPLPAMDALVFPSRDAPSCSLVRSEQPPAAAAALTWRAHLGGDDAQTVAVDGSYLYVGESAALSIFDITLPERPARVARLALPAPVQNVRVAGGRAYIADGYGGWWIVSVVNPRAPVVLGRHALLRQDQQPDYVVTLAVVGDLVYLSTTDNGLLIVNAHDPAHPILRGQLRGVYASDLQVGGTLAYLAAFTQGIQIVDVRDIAHPKLLSRLQLDATALQVVGHYLYAVGGVRDGYFYTLDVRNPRSPALLASIVLEESQGRDDYRALYGIVVRNAVAYITGGGLYTIDLANPASPALLGQLKVPVAGQLFGGQANLQVASGYAFLAGGTAGVQVVAVSNPHQPELRAIAVTANPQDMRIVGSEAFLIKGSQFQVWDLHDPEVPCVLGALNLSADAFGLDVADGVAFILTSTFFGSIPASFLVSVRVDTPQPMLLGVFKLTGATPGGLTIRARDHKVYLGPSILDVSNPAAPTVVATIDAPAGLFDLAGNNLYLVGVDTNNIPSLQIVDISNPANPQLRGRLTLPTQGVGTVRAVGDRVYVANGDASVQIVDVHDADHPALVGNIATSGAATDIAYANGLLYVGVSEVTDDPSVERLGGLEIFELRGNDQVLPRARYLRQANSIPRIQLAGSDIYLYSIYGSRLSGIEVLRLVALPQVAAAIAPAGGTFTSAADGATYSFPAGTVHSTATLSHTTRIAGAIPPTSPLIGVGPAFEDIVTVGGTQIQPSAPYTLTVHYTDTDLAPAIEATLALYRWDGARWLKEPGARIDMTANTITARPQSFGLWAVLGETNRIWLPVINHSHNPLDFGAAVREADHHRAAFDGALNLVAPDDFDPHVAAAR